MSLRTVLILALALVSGLSAVAGLNVLRQPVMAAQAPETVSVVVAVADISRFTTISTDMLTTHPYPKDLVPSGALTSMQEALDRVVFTPILKDEPILNGKLAAKGLGRGMAAGIPTGMQAKTISVPTMSSGVAGFILPGNKVDVLLTVTSNGSKDDPTGGGSATPLLQAVEVLAVDQRVDAPAENKVNPKEMRSVTLLVTPRQAAMLTLGERKGTLDLSLRNPNDHSSARRGAVTMDDIRFLEVKPSNPAPSKPEVVEPAPPPPPLQIRTVRGSHESVILVESRPTAAQTWTVDNRKRNESANSRRSQTTQRLETAMR
jgi:pilus assembly protein CpaB